MDKKSRLTSLFRPEPAVTAVAFLLPDLVDMPLWMLGVVSYPRHIGHTVLFTLLVAMAVSLGNRSCGLLAFCAGMLHLLLKSRGFTPWFYPLKSYDFPALEYAGISSGYITVTLLEATLVTIVLYASWRLLGRDGRMARVVQMLRPEMAAAVFAFLLPDLIDKPLWMMGAISDGRYIGHTLLLTSLVAILFALKKRVYGLVAVCAGMAHLLLDTRGFVPWLFPFKSYDFPTVDYHGVVTWYAVVFTLLELAATIVAVSAMVSLMPSVPSWVRRLRCSEAQP